MREAFAAVSILILVAGARAGGGVEPASARAAAAGIAVFAARGDVAALRGAWALARAHPGAPELAPIAAAARSAAETVASRAALDASLKDLEAGSEARAAALAERLHGLMTLAPLVDDPAYSRRLREAYAPLREGLSDRGRRRVAEAMGRISREVTGDDVFVGLNAAEPMLRPQARPELSTRKRVVAVNADVEDHPRAERLSHYLAAIEEAGAVPLIIPPVTDEARLREYAAQADAFVFIGGQDYPTEAYGRASVPAVAAQHPDRVKRDLKLMRIALEESFKPVLGICAGEELLAIALGGSLIRDLPAESGHRVLADGKSSWHDIWLEAASLLGRVLNADRLRVLSRHHQSADPDGLPSTLKLAARAHDGVAEALELSRNPHGRFVLGVQWHPELMDESHRRALFDAFVAAAGR